MHGRLPRHAGHQNRRQSRPAWAGRQHLRHCRRADLEMAHLTGSGLRSGGLGGPDFSKSILPPDPGSIRRRVIFAPCDWLFSAISRTFRINGRGIIPSVHVRRPVRGTFVPVAASSGTRIVGGFGLGRVRSARLVIAAMCLRAMPGSGC
jgi:hypothetical protein